MRAVSIGPRPFVLAGFVIAGWLAAQAQVAIQDDAPHFHHVHLNVTDPAKTLDFYQRVLGAVPVKFAGTVDSLFTERSFIFLDRVSAPPPAEVTSGIWHLGWGGIDLPNEFAWWKSKGVEFQTPLTSCCGNNAYMYMFGPDRELVEIYSGEQNHRYNHVHLVAADVNKTTQWYADLLGIPLRRREVPKPQDQEQFWNNSIRVDNATINIFGAPDREPVPTWWRGKPLTSFLPTRGRAIDHIAFSFRRLEPVLERARKMGAQIAGTIGVRPGTNLKSFFVVGPENVLLEMVEARPIPDAAWESP